jgi:predicted negative regulator of RcsB-dependent stress response
MNAALEKVLFQLTGKKDINDAGLEELQEITRAYPYFSLGHLLLSKKLKASGHESFATQVQRTAVYFNNPLWLDYQLREERPEIRLPLKNDNETKPLLNRVIIEEQASQEIERQEREDARHIPEIKVNTAQPVQEPNAADATEGMERHPVEVAVEKLGTMITAGPEEERYAADTTEAVLHQAQQEERQKEVISSVLEDQLAEFRKPVAPDAELKIIGEPFHTVDYFASQGIKVDLTQPQDKLGNQLRKFTDWLKQMKTVQTEAKDLGTDPEVENMIQGIAKTSNETREIVTETMAEVLVKQGKTDKAVQLFIKLSFLDPSKSAYFAARIEQLKGI